ncbi:MAG TPA: hypothetical protein PLB55_16330 [Prosthecobacter sp.]|nr:hypothetical protein [Prosthecobacter sp.]
MKTHALTILCLIAICNLNSEAREFIDLQGRKLDAELVAVSGGQAALKRTADGRMFNVPVATFSAEDQKFMNEFAAANIKYVFDVSYTKKKLETMKRRANDELLTTERWSYKVELRNKQPVEIRNLRVDYWLFRKEDEGRGLGAARVATSGSYKLESVKGSAIHAFDTLPIDLNKRQLEGNFIYIDGTRPRSADAMGGIVLRIFDPNDKEVFKYTTDEGLMAAAAGKPKAAASTSPGAK